ncbi:MATH and LRR domain-containing protein PFE0570w-like isoform X1 [Ruditapes philippinarum]|uniref:MATH and LRR domain-containing protein PFE0570w-like isoform X1 n=1 Tax=Ruditapes philippinarum TaxID=129788 RepID=UPI00295A7BB1|nr:MATH and LRR domain-containing protein PFE0570w-like isoform X1 [Ruditapes philippinarum]
MNKNLLLFLLLVVMNYQSTECWDYSKYNLGKLLRIGRTGWDKASTLVQRAVGRVTVTSANNKGGTKINSSRNATNSTQNNSKSTQSHLSSVSETQFIPLTDKEKQLFQRIQTASDKIAYLLKLFNVSERNGDNKAAQTLLGTTPIHTTAVNSKAASTTKEAQRTTAKPYPGAYEGFHPIINITKGSPHISISRHSKNLIRRPRSYRSRYVSENVGRRRQQRKSKRHKRQNHHKAKKPKTNMVTNKNTATTNSKKLPQSFKNRKGKVAPSENSEVLRLLWSQRKNLLKLGRVLTAEVRKLGNQAVDNTNEERADIRSNSDRISEMQTKLSGNINDIRYNVTNLISSQKKLGTTVSVSLENMMEVLNQMVGMITRRDAQIEELSKIKKLDLTNSGSILDYLRNSSLYQKSPGNLETFRPNHILLPKGSPKVSSEVKIIRSKGPAKHIKATSLKNNLKNLYKNKVDKKTNDKTNNNKSNHGRTNSNDTNKKGHNLKKNYLVAHGHKHQKQSKANAAQGNNKDGHIHKKQKANAAHGNKSVEQKRKKQQKANAAHGNKSVRQKNSITNQSPKETTIQQINVTKPPNILSVSGNVTTPSKITTITALSPSPQDKGQNFSKLAKSLKKLKLKKRKHMKNKKIKSSKFHKNHSILNKLNAIHLKKKQNSHKEKFVKKGQNINKGKIVKKGQNIHKGISARKGLKIRDRINAKMGPNGHKKIILKKGPNIHKGITGKKGQNIQKGLTAKKGSNIHKGIAAKKGPNIHKGITARKGSNIHKGIAAKKRSNIHNGTKNKPHNTNVHNHHGKKQAHRHFESYDNILQQFLLKESK